MIHYEVWLDVHRGPEKSISMLALGGVNLNLSAPSAGDTTRHSTIARYFKLARKHLPINQCVFIVLLKGREEVEGGKGGADDRRLKGSDR